MEQPRRPDQSYDPPGTVLSPGARAGIFRGSLVVVSGSGPNKGIFVYSGTPSLGNLTESITAANGTDPYGNVYYAGTTTYAPPVPAGSHTALVVTLLSTVNNAFFQYNSPSGTTQGALIAAVSAANGTDPVTGHGYNAGLFGIDPVFGTQIQVVGTLIKLQSIGFTRSADILTHAVPALSSQNPYVLLDAPEQTTANHMQMLLQGDSPDGTSPSQWLLGRVSGAGVLTPVTNAMAEIQDSTGNGGLFVIGQVAAPAHAIFSAQANAAGDRTLAIAVLGDAISRLRCDSNGQFEWSGGSGTFDAKLARTAAGVLAVGVASLAVRSVGFGFQVAEGANAKQGKATLVGGTVTVANTSVTANSLIVPGYNTPSIHAGAVYVSAVTVGTGFTLTSTNVLDTSIVGYEIFEPA